MRQFFNTNRHLQGYLPFVPLTCMLIASVFFATIGLLVAGVSDAFGEGESRLASGELVDLKPHYSPLALVELFVTSDCKACLLTQHRLNNLEGISGNRRGQIIFLTYTLPKEMLETETDDPSRLSRERIRRRWELYGELFGFKRRTFPELVINGNKFLSLTKPETMERMVNRSLARPVKVAIGLELGRRTRKSVFLKYSIHGLPSNRSNDLYWFSVIAVRPSENIPQSILFPPEVESIWQHSVESVEILRVDSNTQGEMELALSETKQSSVRQLVALLQDARNGQPIAAEVIKVQFPEFPQ